MWRLRISQINSVLYQSLLVLVRGTLPSLGSCIMRVGRNMDECHVCHERCKPLRCTKCRQVWYCSRECQKTHWKAGHKRTCNGKILQQQQQQLASTVDRRQAQTAILELRALLAGNHSLDSLTADYYKASDEVDQLKTAAAAATVAAARTHAARESRRDSETQSNGESADKSPWLSGKAVSSDAFSFSTPKERRQKHQHHQSWPEYVSQWDFWIENLSHISSYQIVLRPKANQDTQQQSIDSLVDSLEMSVTYVGQEKSMVLLRKRSSPNNEEPPIFCARLPGTIQSQPSSFQIGQDSLHIQLKYDDLVEHHLIQESTAVLHETNAAFLACKHCRQRVVRDEAGITRVVRMPSSNWDEIADYLICFSGVSTHINQATRECIDTPIVDILTFGLPPIVASHGRFLNRLYQRGASWRSSRRHQCHSSASE